MLELGLSKALLISLDVHLKVLQMLVKSDPILFDLLLLLCTYLVKSVLHLVHCGHGVLLSGQWMWVEEVFTQAGFSSKEGKDCKTYSSIPLYRAFPVKSVVRTYQCSVDCSVLDPKN